VIRAEIDVRVIPRAKKNELAGMRNGAVLLRVAAPPVEGAANDAVIELLSSLLHIPRKQIAIVGGDRGRRKRVAIAGLTAEQIADLLRRGSARL
jgi:uncharacterized protein